MGSLLALNVANECRGDEDPIIRTAAIVVILPYITIQRLRQLAANSGILIRWHCVPNRWVEISGPSTLTTAVKEMLAVKATQ
jgi:hypothetical protein